MIIIKYKTMLNPIRHLSGKLNHLHIPQTRYLRIVELANSIRPSTKSKGLGEVSVEDITALKSDTTTVDARTYHKFCFDLQVHTEAAVFASPSTIFDDLAPHERKITHLISTYASRLNSRQLLYLNLAFRAKLNGEFPAWNTLHLTEESPSKMDLEVLPTLSAGSRIPELKALPKKIVMKEVIAAKKAVA
jgi:hypothetical protein